ncbi:MAG: aminomethyltransferase family protein [Rhodospirillales bacterium]
MTEELSRTSALASRHAKLGSGLEDWNGMGTAWTYNTDPNDEHDAVRERAGMFDMSPLKKVFIRGDDAPQVADHVISRDVTKIAPGQSAYGTILSDRGTVCDDAIVANNSDDEWMLVHGSGESMERLSESAEGLNVTLELDDDLHDISVQGPDSLEILDAHTPADLASLAYFHHLETTLFGYPCRLSRTGYSGERGYEIFARANVVGDIWDRLADNGVMPCSFTALDKVRIEAALLFFGYDMTSDHTPWEVGLGFTINLAKADYRGKAAVEASRGKERFIAGGIVADHDDMLAGGETLSLDGENVGTVNSPCWSHRMNKSLALVHLRSDAAVAGTRLEVNGEGLSCSATVERTPFYDPAKTRTHA